MKRSLPRRIFMSRTTTMTAAFAVMMAATMAMANAQTGQQTGQTTTSPPPASSTTSTMGKSTAEEHKSVSANHLMPGQIRATDMNGASVYDKDNQKIGDIKDIILD